MYPFPLQEAKIWVNNHNAYVSNIYKKSLLGRHKTLKNDFLKRFYYCFERFQLINNAFPLMLGCIRIAM